MCAAIKRRRKFRRGFLLFCFAAALLFAGLAPSGAKSNSNAAAGGIPHSVRLKVENIPQLPELPNGCEGASLAIVLNYMGYNADKTDVAYNDIPLQPFYYGEYGRLTGANPESAYPGAPGADSAGYYCYPPVVVAAAENFFRRQNETPLDAHDITGASQQTIFRHLAGRSPVIVWKTLHNTPLQKSQSFSWVDSQTNETYIPYTNVHVVVVTGYDQEYVYLSDPLEMYDRLGRAEFEAVFDECGQKAVVLTQNK